MKKRIFVGIFITAHLLFVCALIDKQTRLVKLSYQKQIYEQKIKSLFLKRQLMTNKIHALQNHKEIKTYATNELKMNPLFLKNVKKISLKKTADHE